MYRGTGQLRWPCDIPGCKKDENYYVTTTDAMKFLGMFNGQKNRGWKRFDTFINQNGLVVRHESLPPNKIQRTHVSLSYFTVLILSGGHLQDTEDVLQTYIDDINEFKLNLYTLRDYIRDKCIASLVNNPRPIVDDVGHEERVQNKPLKSTSNLIRRHQNDIDNGDEPRDNKTRQLGHRISQRNVEQKKAIKKIATNIHGGGKSDLLDALAWDISKVSQNGEWDGALSAEDIVNVLKKGKSSKYATESLFDEIVKEELKMLQVNEHDQLFLEDTTNVVETLTWLRKRLPGLFAAENKVRRLKKKYKAEFERILKPMSLPGGTYVDPHALHDALMHVYHYVDGEEWWRLYGDARIMGRRKSTVFGFTNINNVQALKGKGFHSPHDFWRVAIFYFGDDRANLEANLRHDNKNYLNDWICYMQGQGHKIFLSSDAKFQDAVLGGKIGPLTSDGFNIYMETTKEENKLFGVESGLRSEVHPERMLDVPLEHFGICIDHGITRIIEHQLRLVIQEIHTITSLIPGSNGVALRRVRLQHLVNNIKARGVHRNKDGGFHIVFENDQLKQITLNKPSAHLIVYRPYGEPEKWPRNHFPFQ